MKSIGPRAALALLLAAIEPAPVYAATCSCAGAPLLSFIDTAAIEKGQFFISYAAENHEINDLVMGSTDVPDETGRERSSFSQVLSASYAITDRWAVSGLISYVEHSRVIGTSIFGKTETSGLSDSVLLARYTPLFITPFSRHQLSLGLGARIPTGEDDFGSRFVTAEDMQPSTGAWGSIAWAGYSYAFNQSATVQLDLSTSYTINEENDRDYAFGDEFVFAAGVSQTIRSRFTWSGALRYRSTKSDERFGSQVPNTGGEWVDFVPAIQYTVTDRLSLGLSGRIPVWRDLDGALQFTTSYSYSFSATYGF